MSNSMDVTYVCTSCGWESKKWFGLCPKCRTGEGEERKVQASTSSGVQNVYDTGIPKYQGDVRKLLRPVSSEAEQDRVVRTTQYQGLNAILSSGKGFVESQIVLLGASPGVGKSTLCMSIADESTLYISSEETYNQVNQRALRVNPGCKASIMISTSISEILEAIRVCEQSFIIIDSLNAIEFGVGYTTTAKFANEITKAVKETGKVCILISQVTRSGEITGMNSIVHVVDTVMHLERSEISNSIIATSSKNRFGEVGAVAVFRHGPNGLEEVDVDSMQPKAEIGATYTETRFGHKMMTIAIEALVADSQGAFGIRKSNGYNQNRLIQLVGILSYCGRLDLTKKDIYVNVSNGLYTDDISVELAMANSILSCYYGKAVCTKAYGEVRLNGKVSNGTVDGKKIQHINELLELYGNSKTPYGLDASALV